MSLPKFHVRLALTAIALSVASPLPLIASLSIAAQVDVTAPPSQSGRILPQTAPDFCIAGFGLTTIEGCIRLIDGEKRRLAAFKAHNSIPRTAFVRIRLDILKKIETYSEVLHGLRQHVEVGSAPNLAAAAEPHTTSYNYSGVELSTAAYKAPSDYEGVYAVRGTFVVPEMKVPYTANGECDGKTDVTYEQSWWIGIGGDMDSSVYQAGVRGALQCQKGSTDRYVNYFGWIEDFPRDPTEEDQKKFTGKIKAGDVMSVSVTSNYNQSPTGSGIMVVDLTDTTNGITTGNIKESDGNAPPHLNAQAVLERIVQTSGTRYFFPATLVKSTSAMFSGLNYDFVYEVNANTGNKIKFKTLTNLNFNQSLGSGSQCSKFDSYCVDAFLYDAEPDVCDNETGSGPSTTSGGYTYEFIAQPEASGCFAP